MFRRRCIVSLLSLFFLFDFIVSERNEESRRFTVGPLLTLDNKTKSEPGVELLKGLFTYKHHKENKILKLFWFTILGEDDESEVDGDPSVANANQN